MSSVEQGLVFLGATVLMVPLFKKLGLGSVLGYLCAGVAIGPFGARLISDVESILHVAELGVVLFLFVVGLELQPSRLWELRRAVFGWGSLQVLGTGAVLFAISLLLGQSFGASVVAGVGLSLSSTAFALQLLAEKNELTRDFGQASFGILLFQDLAVIPLLAVLPMLGQRTGGPTESWWIAGLKVAGVLVVVVLGGRYVMRPLFRLVASLHSQELFTASALLLVLGTAVIVSKVGLSMALGAFVAGTLLAESEYKHELEADIEPFKGLLLGLFFIAVGMSVNLGLLIQKPLLVLAMVLGLVVVKGLVLFGLGKWVLKSTESSLSLAVVISQGGEFAFVLFGVAAGFRAIQESVSDLLVVVVSLSMAVTPLLYAAYVRWVRPRFKPRDTRAFEVAPEEDTPVIIAGFGRVGQVVGRVLRAKHIPFTAMDSSAEHIDFIKRFGNKVFYGDASRLDLLHAARAHKAKIFVLAIDDVEASIKTAETVRHNFPELKIYARARNRFHAYRLRDLGCELIERETLRSSLHLTEEVLVGLGLSSWEAQLTVARFKSHDENTLDRQYAVYHDETKLRQTSIEAAKELEGLFEQDREDAPEINADGAVFSPSDVR